MAGSETNRRGLAPGQRYFIQMKPSAKSPAESTDADYEWHGEGGAYVFCFPFMILTKGPMAPVEAPGPRYKGLVFPPFVRSSEPEADRLEFDRIPIPSGSVVPGSDEVTVRPNPPSYAPHESRADALRFDTIPKESPQDIESAVEALLSQIRAETLQWWIGRGAAFVKSNLCYGFPIGRNHECVGHVGAFTRAYGLLGFERPLDQTIFQSSVRRWSAGDEVPLYREVFLDAIYYHSLGDLRRATFEAAVAAENMVALLLGRIAGAKKFSKSKLKRLLNLSFEYRLQTAVNTIVGHSFVDQHPDQFEWLKSLWIARGKIAHGDAAVLVRKGGPAARLDDGSCLRMIGAAADLMTWLEAEAKEVRDRLGA